MSTTLSPRQRRVLERLGPAVFAREFPRAGFVREEHVYPDGTREVRFPTPTGGYAIRVGPARPPAKRKPQPLTPEQQARYDRVIAFQLPPVPRKPQPLTPEQQTRLNRVEAFRDYTPRPVVHEPANSLDREIKARLENQPVEFRNKLSRLYSAWAVANESFFGGNLSLPFIRAAPTFARALADCRSDGKESLITFAPQTLRTLSLSDLQDILLHEAIHQSLAEKHSDKYDPHCGGWHHAKFAAVANRIAKMRGWPDVSHKITEGVQAAQYWPPRRNERY